MHTALERTRKVGESDCVMTTELPVKQRAFDGGALQKGADSYLYTRDHARIGCQCEGPTNHV